MKKLSIILAVILVFSSLFSVTFADTTAEGNKNVISISFKVGDEILKINGNEVKVVKPYVVNGSTLVPLRVITEAFGAEVLWEASDKSITITYEDTTILLKLGSNEAVINGEKVKIDVTPAAINGTTMVPLRFITENFGAEVSYDNATKAITVTKVISADGSITDFSDLLSKSGMERVGDSYYDWSMKLPDGFELSSKNYSCDSILFSTPVEDAFIYVLVRDRENETLDYISHNAVIEALNNGETIIENKIINVEGIQFNRLVTKDNLGIYEMRTVIEGDIIYTVILGVYDTTLKNTDEYKSYMDSFKTVFTDESITNDLSNVDDNGYRTYRSDNFNFSFKVPADWDMNDSSDNNLVSFYEFNSDNKSFYNGLSLSMYSKGSVLSLDNMITKRKQIISEEFNPSLVKIISEEKEKINGIEVGTLTETFNYNNETIYNIVTCIVGKDYRYELKISLTAEDYNKASYKAMINYVIDSFKPSEPSVEDVGQLYDLSEALTSNKLYEVMGPGNEWSFAVPTNWNRLSTSNPNSEYGYIDPLYQIGFNFIETKMLPADMYKYYEDLLIQSSQSGVFKNISKEVLHEKEATIYKYTNQIINEARVTTEYYYIIDRNGKTYVVYFEIDDIRMSSKNINLINSIWDSIIFY